MKCFFYILIINFLCFNLCIAQQNTFTLKTQHLTKTKKRTDNIIKPKYTSAATLTAVKIFNRMPNHHKKENKRPIFCELEHQLSRAIKRNVKFGVNP